MTDASTTLASEDKSRLRALPEHFSVIEDPREPWKAAHPLQEVLLLVVSVIGVHSGQVIFSRHAPESVAWQCERYVLKRAR